MRRIPDLKSDIFITFNHLFSDKKIELLTPSPEELFANKIYTKGFEQQLQNLILSEINIEDIEIEAFNFANEVIIDIKNQGWNDFKTIFYLNGILTFEYFKNPEAINPNINQHPQLKWLIKKK